MEIKVNIPYSDAFAEYVKTHTDENGKFTGSIDGELDHPSNDPFLDEINEQISMMRIDDDSGENGIMIDSSAIRIKKEDFDNLMKSGYHFEPVIPSNTIKRNENNEIIDCDIIGFDIDVNL